jgi:hypothetical protein
MPPRPGDEPRSKSETARVSVPGKTARSASPLSESEERNQDAHTNMPGGEIPKDASPPVKPAVGVAKPSFPAPPMPKPPVSAPPSAPRPPKPPAVAGSAPKPPFVPKPPVLRTKPSTMPAAPLTPASSQSGAKEADRGPVSATAGSAKRETARIQAPSHNKELSRATLKMEQPKPFAAAPVTENEPAAKGESSAMTWLAIAALLAAALSLFFSYLAFTSA